MFKRAATSRPVFSRILRTTDLSRLIVCQDLLHTMQRGSSKRRKRIDYSVLSRQWGTRAQLDGNLPKLPYSRGETREHQSRSIVKLLGCKTRRWSWSTVVSQTNFVDNFSRMNVASSTIPLKTEVSTGCFFTYLAYLSNKLTQSKYLLKFLIINYRHP